jgi:CRP/FNR family cyclic AMP-dependent transcriptional regulator
MAVVRSTDINRSVAKTMKRVLDRLRGRARVGLDSEAEMLEDSRFFSSMFTEQADDAGNAVTWQARQAGLGARPFGRRRGAALFAELWNANRLAAALTPPHMARLAQYLQFVRVPAGQEVIGQDEHGDYVLLVLEGRVGVDRLRASTGRTRLAEARPGDLLGEMSFLDAGTRMASCRTLEPTVLAVLSAARLDDLTRDEPQLASALVAFLARCLSLRLRQASARLSGLLSREK